MREGIEWVQVGTYMHVTHVRPMSCDICFVVQIDYFNNKVICDLVEMKQSGVISLLDEACFLVGTVTDKVRTTPKTSTLGEFPT